MRNQQRKYKSKTQKGKVGPLLIFAESGAKCKSWVVIGRLDVSMGTASETERVRTQVARCNSG